MSWDPIEGVVDEDRGKYIDLIKHFLWMDMPDNLSNEQVNEPAKVQSLDDVVITTTATTGTTPQDGQSASLPGSDAAENTAALDVLEEASVNTPKKKSKNKKKKAVESQVADKKPAQQPTPTEPRTKKTNSLDFDKRQGSSETKDEVRQRLRTGVERDHSRLWCPQLADTAQNPYETIHRTAPVPEDEVEQYIEEITEVKALLFCRALLSHASLLQLAIRSESVEDFLASAEISISDLRELCLQTEQPTLEQLRDACADFARGDQPEADLVDDAEDEDKSAEGLLRRDLKYEDSADQSLFASMLSFAGRKRMADLADIYRKENKGPKPERMRVRICGRSIWNYASEQVMPRSGWLQFSIMAKDCYFEDAIWLCRNWDEFFELQILALWHFFPTSKWSSWQQNSMVNELLQLVRRHWNLMRTPDS